MDPTGAGAAVSCAGLTRSFGAVRAVDAIDLQIPRGTAFGLLGPNGAGKTTLLRMLTTLLPPTAGNATVMGHDIRTEAAAVRRAIGYVPQVLSAEGALSGRENLLIFAKLYDVPRREREARITDALATVGLSEAARRTVKTYSGGMVRRLEVAQSLLHRPQVLFLDEPTVGLDPTARAAVWSHIHALRRELGMTVVLTTHYMEEADRLCDQVAILHRGRVATMGTPAELKSATGRPGATLEDAFAHATGATLEGEAEQGDLRDTQSVRRTARRLG